MADVEITYFRPSPLSPVVRRYAVAPLSRFNVWVNLAAPELAATDLSAQIVSSVPIVAERAMYLDGNGLPLSSGHVSAGVVSAAPQWVMAEGATGPYFDLFVLIANPSTQTAQVTVDYLLPDGGRVSKAVEVGARSRVTLWVDVQDPRLANTAVSTVVRSTNGVPIVAERSMWWPMPWSEGHASPGSTVTGRRWVVTGGQVDPFLNNLVSHSRLYVLVANTSAAATDVLATLRYEDGRSEERRFGMLAGSRLDLDIWTLFPNSVLRRFSVVVESVGSAPGELVVESSSYSDRISIEGPRRVAIYTHWAAGASSSGTRLP